MLGLLSDDSIRGVIEQVQTFPNESVIDDDMAEILDQLSNYVFLRLFLLISLQVFSNTLLV